jgi:hypothetical protein
MIASPRTEAAAINALIDLLDGDETKAWVAIVAKCIDQYRAYLHTVRSTWHDRRKQLDAHPRLPPKLYAKKRAEVNRAAARVAAALANLDDCYSEFEEAVRHASV